MDAINSPCRYATNYSSETTGRAIQERRQIVRVSIVDPETPHGR
jgi:hypothetical protein